MLVKNTEAQNQQSESAIFLLPVEELFDSSGSMQETRQSFPWHQTRISRNTKQIKLMDVR